MRIDIYKIVKGSALLLIFIACGISCKKEKDATFQQIRMFKPGDIKITTEQTKATFEWDPSLFTTGKDVKYTVEVSKDSTFASVIDFTTVVDTTKAEVTDEKLAVRQKYYARVKANALNDVPESKWVVSTGFSITGEQIFNPVQVSDVIDKAVILRWKSTEGLTKILITPNGGGPSVNIDLDATDVAATNKLINNLTPNTTYTAEIFQGTKSKGLISFTTKQTIAGNNVIDLRGITGRPSVLADTLPLVPAGSIIVLQRGLTYNISSAINLDKSITIMSGDDLFNPDLAVIYFTSNFNFVANSTIDAIVFNSVTLRSDSYSSRYVFNTTNGATVNNLSFLNCKAEIFRGLVRLQSGTTTVNNFTVDNCIIDSLANYGVITVDNITCKANNITMKNSTIYKAEKVITSTKQTSVSVDIENCTFNETPLGNNSGSMIVNYGTFTPAVKIVGCIFGIGKWNSGNTSGRGIAIGGSPDVSNNYVTSDYISAGNAIPSLISYPSPSTNLWADPSNGNFKIIDNNFSGKSNAGDPRWRP